MNALQWLLDPPAIVIQIGIIVHLLILLWIAAIFALSMLAGIVGMFSGERDWLDVTRILFATSSWLAAWPIHAIGTAVEIAFAFPLGFPLAFIEAVRKVYRQIIEDRETILGKRERRG
jgi:hypothetical protein